MEPPTRPFRRPRVSRAAADAEGSDAVTVTTALRVLRAADVAARASARVPTPTPAPGPGGPGGPGGPAPGARRLPPPSETGRFPSPRPRAGGDAEREPDTVTVASTPAPAPTPAPTPAPAPAPSSTPAAPAVRRAAPAPADPAPVDSAAALERAGLAGLHPLTREQPVKRGMRRLVTQVPAPYTVVGDGEDVPALLTRLYAMVVRDHWGGGDGDTTHVVQLTPWYVCDLGFELVGAGRILGHAPVHGDVSPDLPVDPPEPDDPAAAPPGAPTPTVLSLRHPTLDDAARAALTDAGRVVLAADTARSDRRRVHETVTGLRELGVVVAGLVVYRGRIPRDPAFAR